MHRGVYTLSERATAEFEGARDEGRAVRERAVGARGDLRRATRPRRSTSSRTRGACSNLGPGDLVVVTELEHHSNFVPWQYIAQTHGRRVPDAPARRQRRARPRRARRDRSRRQREGRRDEPRLERARHDQPGRAARPPGRTSRARSWSSTPRRPRRTARSTCRRSAATSSPSRRTRCAARAASARSGAARELLEAMEPFHLGGHMIRKVRFEGTTWGDLPHKFEAGTAPIAEAVGVRRRDRLPERDRPRRDRGSTSTSSPRTRSSGSARSPGIDALRARRRPPRRDRLVQRRGRPPARRGADPRLEGVAIRAGHHCCQPLMAKLGVAATNRASFYLYTIPEEIDRLVEGLHRVTKCSHEPASSTSCTARSSSTTTRTRAGTG